ncbi:hypothetical protein OOU_Y34scaffold00485g17 [Pyricularia oryzae Y34]|uniref:Uncharacterized protein n=2 Tax=Pyricularia oryzae TaxID=318829 RepID=A0AA97P0L9_PYRO3|nr:hypothetical protein OOU_Y34scaffold00485g17 [Pyricularia oryzae Y34]
MPLLMVRFFSHFAEHEAVVGACFPQALAEQLGIGNAVKAWLGVMGGETPSPWSEYFAALWVRKRGSPARKGKHGPTPRISPACTGEVAGYPVNHSIINLDRRILVVWNDRQTLIVGGTSRLDKVSSRNWMALLEATKSRRAEDNSGDPRHLCTRATGYPPILGHPGHRLHVVFDWSAAWKGVHFKAAAGRGDVGGEREGQV